MFYPSLSTDSKNSKDASCAHDDLGRSCSSLVEAAVRPDRRPHQRPVHVPLERPQVIVNVGRRADWVVVRVDDQHGTAISLTVPIGFVRSWYSASDEYPSTPYRRRCSSAMSGAAMSSSPRGFVRALEPSNQLLVRRQNISLTDASKCRSSKGSNRENAPPSVVSYPGHTHDTAANGYASPSRRCTSPRVPCRRIRRSQRASRPETHPDGFGRTSRSAVTEEVELWRAQGPRCPRRRHTTGRKPASRLPSRARQSRRRFPSAGASDITGAADGRDAVTDRRLPDRSRRRPRRSTRTLERDLAAVLRRQRLSSPPASGTRLRLRRYAMSCASDVWRSSGGLNGRCRAGHESTSLAMRGDLDSVSLGGAIRGCDETRRARGSRRRAPRARCPETRRTPR